VTSAAAAASGFCGGGLGFCGGLGGDGLGLGLRLGGCGFGLGLGGRGRPRLRPARQRPRLGGGGFGDLRFGCAVLALQPLPAAVLRLGPRACGGPGIRAGGHATVEAVLADGEELRRIGLPRLDEAVRRDAARRQKLPQHALRLGAGVGPERDGVEAARVEPVHVVELGRIGRIRASVLPSAA
jgi:putative hemolysin